MFTKLLTQNIRLFHFIQRTFFQNREPVNVLHSQGCFDVLYVPCSIQSADRPTLVSPSFVEWLAINKVEEFRDVSLSHCLLDLPSSHSVSDNIQSVCSLPGNQSLKFDQPFFKTFVHHKVTFESFHLSYTEHMQTAILKSRVFMYALERYTILKYNLNTSMPSMKCKFAMEAPPQCEKSSFAYIKIYNEKADCISTMTKVLLDLYSTFGVSAKVNHVVVVGDLKTFEYLMKIKAQYKRNSDWMVPWPGDLHILKNYQEVIMKVLWEAGLKEVAKLKHKSLTYQKLASCSNFKRTHRFPLQIYEALYIHKLKAFVNERDSKSCPISTEDIFQTICDVVKDLNTVDESFSDVHAFVKKQQHVQKQLISGLESEFHDWSCSMAAKYNTFASGIAFFRKICFIIFNSSWE